MSRDNNTEDDAIEIDLGSIGRRLGGFFGKKAGKEKEGLKTGEKKDGEAKEPEKSAETQNSQPKEEVPPAAGKKEPERGEEPSPIDIEKKEGGDAKEPENEKDASPADSEEDYFEVDLGGLFGRKKAESEKKSSTQAVEAETQKAEGKEQKEEKKTAPEKHETVKESKEDEEIEIDFGKLFGRKKKEAEPAHPKKHHKQEEPVPHDKGAEKQEKGGDDAVEIDFGKIGASISGLFGGKKRKETAKKETGGEDEIKVLELDIDSIGRAILSHKSMVVFLLLAAVVAFSLHIRLLSAGSPLSPDYDTYLHYRYAQYLIENNFEWPGWDEKSYYPPGREMAESRGYPTMEAYLYLLLRSIWPDTTLMQSAMVLTALFGGLVTIPAYVIGKEASGRTGGLLAAFLIGTVPAILIRTMGSYADTDAAVLFFSVLTFALFIKAVEAVKEKLTAKPIVLALLAGMAAYLFYWFWISATYVLSIILLAPVAIFTIYFLSSKNGVGARAAYAAKRSKDIFVVTLIVFSLPYFVFGFDAGGVAGGIGNVYHNLEGTLASYISPLDVTQLKSETGGVAGTGRNVYISVAEMQPPVLENYTSQLGITIYLGLLFFVLGSSLLAYRFVEKKQYGTLTYAITAVLLAGSLAVNFVGIITQDMHQFLSKFLMVAGIAFLLAGLFKKSQMVGEISGAFFETDMHMRALAITLVWGGAVFVTSTLGVRFLMILAPPIAITAGVLMDRVMRASKIAMPKAEPLLLLGIPLLLLVQFAPSAYSMGVSARGTMDPQWHDMLIWLKLNSAPDATVTTWWDPGHWVTGIADRRSGADGAHYPGGPRPVSTRIRDFGWAFTTTNETESIGTLRPYRGNASEMFLISSNDLIGKFVWLSYFSTGEKQQYVILGESGSYQQNGAILHMYPVAQNVVIVVQESGDELEPWLYVNNNKLRIKQIVYFDQNGNVQKQSYKDGEDAMVWMQGDKKVIVYMPGSIKDNILTRTYFFGGEGLDNFKLEFANQQIKLYNVKF